MKGYLLIIPLLLYFLFQATLAAREDSVTIDEYLHLPLGYYFLQTGDLSLDPINPPLARLLWALPLMLTKPDLSIAPTNDAWGIGTDFMYRNQERYHAIFVESRFLVIGAALVLLFLIYYWSKQVFGERAAIAALFLACFSPDLLAHGHLVTTDLLATLMFSLTLFGLWRYWRKPSVSAAMLTGFSFGLAVLVKFSCLILVLPICVIMAMLGVKKIWRDLVLTLFLATIVINAGYGFHGTFLQLRQISFVESGKLNQFAQALPWLRLPLPSPCVQGFDRILEEGTLNQDHTFLFGETSTRGWWYYHLVAFLVKTPLPIILLFFGAVFTGLRTGGPGRDTKLYLLGNIFLVFLFNSLFNSQQIGVRHVLIAYPLIFLLSGAYLSQLLNCISAAGPLLVRLGTGVACGLILWLFLETSLVSPRFIQYFNELAGGPENGHKVLIDSNIDWGQDLVRLKRYMERQGIDSIKLAYFGKVNPKIYGVKFSPLELDSKGVVAISASFLMGRPFWWYKQGVMQLIPANYYSRFRDRLPIARVGAFFIFDLK